MRRVPGDARAASSALLALACACAPTRLETRQYGHLGKLRAVVIYEDPAQASRDCVERSGGRGDLDRPLRATDACADMGAGIVRISARTSAITLLHELCHIEGELSRAECDRLFPGD